MHTRTSVVAAIQVLSRVYHNLLVQKRVFMYTDMLKFEDFQLYLTKLEPNTYEFGKQKYVFRLRFFESFLILSH